MEKTTVNVQTGEVAVSPMTPEEIASIQQVAAEWASRQPAKTKVFKADIWRRATEGEAEAIDALLNAQSARLRRLWADISFLTTTDPLYPMVLGGAVQLFGQARAEELLEPTE